MLLYVLLCVKMNDNSDNEEPYEDSESEYLPDHSDEEEDDSWSSASDTDNEVDVPVTMGDFTVVADPFSVISLITIFVIKY